jgi:hypothetical protein
MIIVIPSQNLIIKIFKKVNQEELLVAQEADQSLLKKEKALLQIKLFHLIPDNKFMKLNLRNT